MTAKITQSILKSQAFNNIFDVMNIRTNIADPRDAEGKNTRTFIYDADPFPRDIEFNDVPYIVLNLPTILKEEPTVDAKHKKVTWKHRIFVRTGRDGSSNQRTDTGRTDLLNICDDIHEMFNSRSIKDDFHDIGIKNIKLEEVDSDVLTTESNKEIYEAEFSLTYNQRMQVSS